jgi:DNA-binding MarR family transcriptional regulator
VHTTETTGDLLTAVARMQRRRFAAALEAYDVTPGQARALHVLLAHGAVRLSELADRLRIVRRSATEVADALEDRGLATRVPDPDDRRGIRVNLTAQGERLAAVLEDARRAESERLVSHLSSDDRAELDRILRLLLADR